MLFGFSRLSRLADVASAVVLGGVTLGVVLSITAGVVAMRAGRAVWSKFR